MVGMDSVVVALAIHAAAASPGAAASFTTPSFLASLPCAGTEGAYSEIYGVRSDGGSGVFVVDYWDSRIYKFDNAGHEITHWSVPDGAHGIALSPTGELFIANGFELGLIDVYTSSGIFLRQIGESMGALGQMHNPIYPYVTPEGTLLVSDAQNQRVIEFEPGGTPIRSWGGPGAAPGQFGGPRGIAMDGAGDILVVDEGNKRVQVFSRTGAYLRQWAIQAAWYEGHEPFPRGIAVDNLGRIYVTDRSNAVVRVYQSDGTEIGTWGGFGTDPGHFYGPNAVDVDPLGRIYVGESYCHVQVFGRDGATALPRVTWGRLKARYR